MERDDEKATLLLPDGFDQDSLVTFLKYLTSEAASDKFLRLYSVFGTEIFLFLSLFQAETIKVPSLGSLKRIKDHCLIYTFLRRRNFSVEAYKQCSKVFKRRQYQLENIVERVDRIVSEVTAQDGRRKRAINRRNSR